MAMATARIPLTYQELVDRAAREGKTLGHDEINLLQCLRDRARESASGFTTLSEDSPYSARVEVLLQIMPVGAVAEPGSLHEALQDALLYRATGERMMFNRSDIHETLNFCIIADHDV